MKGTLFPTALALLLLGTGCGQEARQPPPQSAAVPPPPIDKEALPDIPVHPESLQCVGEERILRQHAAIGQPRLLAKKAISPRR